MFLSERPVNPPKGTLHSSSKNLRISRTTNASSPMNTEWLVSCSSMTREFFTPERKRWIVPSIHFASDSMLRLNSLNCTRQQSCLVGLGRWRIESLTPYFDDLTLVGRSAWCPVPLDRPSNRDECSLRFETLHNTGNEQRGILGSALLEEKYVLRCLSARAITD